MTVLAAFTSGGSGDQIRSLDDVEGRIVGGMVVEPAHKYPFQVSCARRSLDFKWFDFLDLSICWWVCLWGQYLGLSARINSQPLPV